MELGEALAGTREQYSDVKAREVNEEEGEHVQVSALYVRRARLSIRACNQTSGALAP